MICECPSFGQTLQDVCGVLPENSPQPAQTAMTCCRSVFALPSGAGKHEFDKDSYFVKANKASLANYLDSCYTKVQDPYLASSTITLIQQVSGVLIDRTGTPICSAFRISERSIVTARHCVWIKPNTEENVEHLKFSLLADPRTWFAVKDAPNPDVPHRGVSESDDDRTDYWLLESDTHAVPLTVRPDTYTNKLPDPEVTTVSSPWGGNKRIWLRIPAFKQYACMLRSLEQNNQAVCESADYWSDSFRIDMGCQLDVSSSAKAPGCIVERCQTLGAMSGAAIYAHDFRENRWKVVGIHLRGGARPYSEGCPDIKSENMGILLPKPILKD
jgi:hypothetical protein